MRVCQTCLDIAFVFTLVIEGRQAARYYFRTRIHSLRMPDGIGFSSHGMLTGDKLLDICFCKRFPCKQQCSPRAFCHVTPTPRPPDVLKGWGRRLSTMATVASALGSSRWGLDFKEANFRNFRCLAVREGYYMLVPCCDDAEVVKIMESQEKQLQHIIFFWCFSYIQSYPCHVLHCAEAFQQQPIASFVGHPSPWSNVCGGASLVVVTRWDPDERKSGNREIGVCADDCRSFFVLYLLIFGCW